MTETKIAHDQLIEMALRELRLELRTHAEDYIDNDNIRISTHWISLIAEVFGEAAEIVNAMHCDPEDTTLADYVGLRLTLIHLAAICVSAWIDHLFGPQRLEAE